MNKHIAPVAGVVAAVALIVGGVAAAQAMGDSTPIPAPPVVQPVAQTATPEPVATTSAPTTTSAPKPVAPKPAPVESSTSAVLKKAPAPVQRQAVVSEPAPETTTSEPAPEPSPTAPPGVIDWRKVNPPPPPPPGE